MTPPSWVGYVVSTRELRQTLIARQAELVALSTSPRAGAVPMPGDDLGWRNYIAQRVSVATGRSVESITRRLYSITSLESDVVSADVADAILLSIGLMIDRDTTISTYPGNIRTAKEMVSLRRPHWTNEQVERGAARLLEYRNRRLWPNGYQRSAIAIRQEERRRKRATEKVAA